MDDSFFGATSQVRSITHNQTDFHWVNVGDIFFFVSVNEKRVKHIWWKYEVHALDGMLYL